MLLRFDHDALQLFENRELFVRRVYLGITLLLSREKSNFFETLQLALNVTWVLFDKLCESANVSMKIRILGVDDDNLSTDTGCNKNV